MSLFGFDGSIRFSLLFQIGIYKPVDSIFGAEFYGRTCIIICRRNF